MTDNNAAKRITYKTELLKSNLCDYNDTQILVRSDITVTTAPATQVAFKNFALCTECITKIDEKTVDGANNLDLLMPMCNLREYHSNYSKSTGSF